MPKWKRRDCRVCHRPIYHRHGNICYGCEFLECIEEAEKERERMWRFMLTAFICQTCGKKHGRPQAYGECMVCRKKRMKAAVRERARIKRMMRYSAAISAMVNTIERNTDA